jgi:hypothetical protein
VRYPIGEIPGVDVELGDAKPTGVDKDFDAEPTGVEVDTGTYGKAYDAVTGSYGEAYDAVPQEQGNKIEVYGLGQQGQTEGMVFVEKNTEKYRIQFPTSRAQQRLKLPTQVKHKVVAMTRVMALMLKLVMLVTLTETPVAHKSMKALPTKREGADAESAMNN